MRYDIASARTRLAMLFPYVQIARPDHWIKNIFVLPGFAAALALTPTSSAEPLQTLFLGLIAVCLLASANYVMNEWLDRFFDQHHPQKRQRPAAQGVVRPSLVLAEYLFLVASGMGIAGQISTPFTFISFAFLVMGWLYNVPPLRTKDRLYVDVLSEALNNPIRLMHGWFLVTAEYLPPSSLLVAYWMGGAYLMGIKRYSEFRTLGGATMAGIYRPSLGKYTEESLLGSSLFYAMCTAFFGGVFLIKYRVEMILLFPFLSALFVWYFHLARRPNSAAQHPERLHREPLFLVYVAFVTLLGVLCIFIKIPRISLLLQTTMVPIGRLTPWAF